MTICKIKPQYQNDGEGNLYFKVVEDNGDRLCIMAIGLGLTIPPLETVSRDHVNILS